MNIETVVGMVVAAISTLVLIIGLFMSMGNLKIFVIVVALLGIVAGESLHQSSK